jgi:integrase/recombinase XerC
MRFSDAVVQFIADLGSRKRSPWTLRAYRTDLEHLHRALPRDTVLCVTDEVLRAALIAWSADGAKQATLCRRQAAIRSFCKWGHRRRLWTENPAAGLEAIPIPDRLPRPFDGAQAEQLFALELPESEDLARSLLAYTGIRVATLCGITLGNISFEGEECRIRVVTKGGRVQVVEAHPELAKKLAAHLITRQGSPRTDALLANPYGRAWNTKTIWRWTTSWGLQCEPPILQCHPHRFRHEFATRLLEQTSDVRLVQEALGHRSIVSTMRYTRVRSSRLRAAISAVSYGSTRGNIPQTITGPVTQTGEMGTDASR